MDSIFENGWESNETICGWGSELVHTGNIRRLLPILVKKYGIKVINDAGCGDLNWMRYIDLNTVDYGGYDIIARETWGNVNLSCTILDITSEIMRPCDLIICRDVFIHMPNDLILRALNLFRQSGKLLLTTSYDGVTESDNLSRDTSITKRHSKLCMELPPFSLKPMDFTIEEDYLHKYTKLYEI